MAMSKDEFRAKVTSDAAFREEFKKDPVGMMRSMGWDVDDGASYEVVDIEPTKQYFVLPPLQSQEIGEEELASVQGGANANANLQGPVCTW